MTQKSRIYAPIETHPLPKEDCKIDIKLHCGSELIGCGYRWSTYSNYGLVWFAMSSGSINSISITADKIKYWRFSK